MLHRLRQLILVGICLCRANNCDEHGRISSEASASFRDDAGIWSCSWSLAVAPLPVRTFAPFGGNQVGFHDELARPGLAARAFSFQVECAAATIRFSASAMRSFRSASSAVISAARAIWIARTFIGARLGPLREDFQATQRDVGRS
ncbi:hypothetical protein [Methylobacterium sp. AMS5]|uniref:hypothetical protein n=1 Tax=Methylobacterium sp. AMS5 TaxID=925818 RepID=UPI00118762C6|nr:hypothetical protein [Methylobacterium sp. AMS5]